MTEFLAERTAQPSPSYSPWGFGSYRPSKILFLLRKRFCSQSVCVPGWALPSCGGIADPERLMGRRRGA